MNYKVKIQYATQAAEQLVSGKSLDQIKQELKEKGIYEFDINNIIASARNIIGEKQKPLIRAKLLSGDPINNAKEFEKLDNTTLEKLIQQERQAIAIEEKKKVYQLLNQGMSPYEIYKEIRLDFHPKIFIDMQIADFKEIKKQNSGSGRMVNIIGGLALVIIGGGMTYASLKGEGRGRFSFGLIIVGLIMLGKGFMTAPIPR